MVGAHKIDAERAMTDRTPSRHTILVTDRGQPFDTG